MEKELETMEAEKLQETYLKVKDFINYLDKECKEIEKMREGNE